MAVGTGAARNRGIQMSLQGGFPLALFPDVGWLGHVVIVFSVF